MVDLVSLYFHFYFLFFLIYFSSFLFLELRIRVSDDITWSYLGHIRQHSDSDSYKSHNTQRDIEGSGRMISYNV